MRGRPVLVTGAGAGIGRAICLACARRGAQVAALDLDAVAARSTADSALAAGAPRAVALTCDVASEEATRRAFDAAAETIGDPVAVCANAAIEENAPLHGFPADRWRRVLEVNLVGVFLTCREALRRLIRTGQGGSVVCTSSPAAFVGHAGGGNSAYAASKGGVSAFVRSAAVDYARHGIRINAVVPGATDTALLGASRSRIAAAASAQIPLGRLADPAEIAAAVTWLLSDDSSYVTGSQLICDGGLLTKSANDF